MITIEKIDEFRKRTNASYEEAKVYLERYDGDMVEAVIEFEKKHGKTSSSSTKKSFGESVKEFFTKLYNTRLIVTKDKNVIVNLSLLFIIIVALFAFWILIIGGVMALLLGYKFKIKQYEETVNVDDLVKDVSDRVKNFADANTKKDENKNTESKENEYTVE